MNNSELTNTEEWAERTINLFKGKCQNGCIYCYRTADIVRFNQNPLWEIKPGLITHNFRKREYLTMYPSGHDIRMEDIVNHVAFLKNFLKSGSKLLIVSKPKFECILWLATELIPFKEQVEFRFTIGSSKNEVLNFYEPNAPTFTSRVDSLVTASAAGYKTSISIEPMLDTYPDAVIEAVLPHTTGDIWIGKINHTTARVKHNGYHDKLSRITMLKNWQSKDDNILGIVSRLSKYPQVKWKNSIRNVIEKHKITCQV